MTVELAFVLTAAGIIFAIYHGNSNLKIKTKKVDREEITQLALIMSELKNISTGVTEIKADMSSMRTDIKENRDKITDLTYGLKEVKNKQDECEGYYKKKLLLKRGDDKKNEDGY